MTLSDGPDHAAIAIRSEHEEVGLLSDDIWHEARAFLAVAKAGTMVGAAHGLNVKPLTISRQVRRLQDRLGSTLFIATTQGVTLTAKGREFADVLLRVDKQLYSAVADLRTETTELKGVVRVSITEGLATVFLAPALTTFGARYPHIQLQIKAPISKNSLSQNQTDIMVGFMSDRSRTVTTAPLGPMSLLPCASRGYVARRGMPRLETLSTHDFVECEQYARGTALWGPWHALLDQGTCRHLADTSMVYAMLVRSGLGIGLLSNYATTDPELIPVGLPCRVSVPLFTTALTERLSSKPVRAVFDFISDLYGTRNPWFANGEAHTPMGPRDVKPSTFAFWDQRITSPGQS